MKSKSLNILVVEDEFITANAIKETLIFYGHSVAGIARDALDAIEILDTNEIDIAILDINIQGSRDGIWLGNKIRRDYNLPFIFITAYGDEASIEKAIEVKPAGYLTKPFKKADIHSTISLALKNLEENSSKNETLPQQNLNELETFFVKGTNKHLRIILKDILYVKSDHRYVELHTTNQQHILRYNLQDIGEKLPTDTFVRVHRSYIVNKKKIEGIGPNHLEINGQKIPISANKKEEILSQFKFL